MIRKIIHIDEKKCNGCGLCATACHEGAIEMINGKAKPLIAADCTAYAYANIHEDFMKGRITLIGCPKLDAIDYSEKLAEVLKSNDISDVLMLRMQVPCCGGLQRAVENAINNCGKTISYKVVTISREGNIVE